VPHHLHAEMYGAIIRSGKALFGEKPFGIDQTANTEILATLRAQPQVFARCSSEFPFFPAVQRIFALAESGAFGRIIEVNTGFLHSSDLDPTKPINWKRQVRTNGAYGVMGDLGMHACHVPFRLGWTPRNVRAVLSNIVETRPDGKGGVVPCETWDNATLLCEAEDRSGTRFPWTLKTQRIAPGQKNTWYVEVYGTKASVRFSTKNPKRLELLLYTGGEQAWQEIDVGYTGAFKTLSGEIFEFGFTDAMQQMTAAFCYELVHGVPLRPSAGCVTPEETALSHRLFTAALRSQAGATTEIV
jgi:predicted dehydrogenase